MTFEDFTKKTQTEEPIQLSKEPGATTDELQPQTSWVMYPSDLFTPANEAHILFFKRDPVNSGQPTKDNFSAKRIALYMPPAMRINYGANWEELKLTIQQRGDIGNEAWQGVKNAVAGDPLYEAFKGVGQIGLGNAADYVMSGEDVTGQLEYYTKKVRNPRLAMMFKGVDFRTFNFTFQMMARNEQESEAIRQIILAFKSAMHPSVEGGKGNAETDTLYWDYPDVFNIYLRTGVGVQGDEYLYQIKTAALTGMSVDYAGSGVPSFFSSTGAPVDIIMDLTFKELSILTRSDVHRGY